jgi:hypothetical protein
MYSPNQLDVCGSSITYPFYHITASNEVTIQIQHKKQLSLLNFYASSFVETPNVATFLMLHVLDLFYKNPGDILRLHKRV